MVRIQYDHDFFSKKTKDLKQYRQPSTVFETDFNFKTSQPVANCTELFNGCVLNLHKKTLHKESSLTNKWVFAELTLSSDMLAQKLFQLERAVRFLPLLDPKFTPAALCVLMNGEERDAVTAVDLIRIPPGALILKYPLYIGWVPTRNIFSMFNNLKQNFVSMETKIGGMETKVKGFEAKLQTIENLLTRLVEKK